jgi:hypothetical protein
MLDQFLTKQLFLINHEKYIAAIKTIIDYQEILRREDKNAITWSK